MCWTSLKEFGIPQARTAEEDIIVYKIVAVGVGGIYSYFQNFGYKKQKEYCLDGELIIDGTNDYYYSISNGFHSYSGMCKVWVDAKVFIVSVYSLTEKIYWNYINNATVVAECVVPKGSTYYENKNGEIVSNKIILTGRTLSGKEIYTGIINKLKRLIAPNKCMHFCDLFKKSKD